MASPGAGPRFEATRGACIGGGPLAAWGAPFRFRCPTPGGEPHFAHKFCREVGTAGLVFPDQRCVRGASSSDPRESSARSGRFPLGRLPVPWASSIWGFSQTREAPPSTPGTPQTHFISLLGNALGRSWGVQAWRSSVCPGGSTLCNAFDFSCRIYFGFEYHRRFCLPFSQFSQLTRLEHLGYRGFARVAGWPQLIPELERNRCWPFPAMALAVGSPDFGCVSLGFGLYWCGPPCDSPWLVCPCYWAGCSSDELGLWRWLGIAYSGISPGKFVCLGSKVLAGLRPLSGFSSWGLVAVCGMVWAAAGRSHPHVRLAGVAFLATFFSHFTGEGYNQAVRLAWIVAARFLAKRTSGLLTASSRAALVAISLGVAALLVTTSLMNGYREALRRGILSASGHLLVMAGDGEEALKAIQTLQKKPGITWVGPVHFLSGLAATGRGGGGEVVTLKATENPPPFVTLPQGRFASPLPVAMGQGLAERLGLQPGQTLLLQLAHPAGRPVYLPAQVQQIFQVSFAELQQSWLFCSEKALTRLVPDLPQTIVEVYLKDPESAESFAEDILSQAPMGLSVRSWQEMNRELFAALRWQKITLAMVLSLILGVGAFEVASSLVVLITEKRRELGILMAMGASGGLVRKVVVMAGSALGAGGVLGGLLLGGLLVVVANWLGLPHFSPELASVYMVDRITWQPHVLDVAWVVLGGISEVLVVSVATARPISRREPAEVIRWA